MIGLGVLPGGSFGSIATGVNDLGEVTGWSHAELGDEAFRWTPATGMVSIGELPGGQHISIAKAINNRTQIVGWSVSDRGFEAFIWEPGLGMRGICCDTPGIWFDDARAINNLGQVAGTGVDFVSGGIEGAIWDAAKGVRLLGILPGVDPYGAAVDVNDHGVVIGSVQYQSSPPYNSGPGFAAFVWDEVNGIRSISHMLDASGRPPYHWVGGVEAINNAGQIATGGVLLTPFTLGDMNCDKLVNEQDVGPFALALVDYSTYELTYPDCHGEWAGDLNQDAVFNAEDIQPFVNCLLAGGDCRRARIDFWPPSPDPAVLQGVVPPWPGGTDSLHMSALPAYDIHSPPVEYVFEFMGGTGYGGNSSGWRSGWSAFMYTDDGLQPNSSYSYRVMARDSYDPPNVTQPSDIRTGTTRIETPQALEFGAVTRTTVQMTAVGTFTNLTEGQSALRFETTASGTFGGLNQWVQATSTTATGLRTNTEYTFRVKARNRVGAETEYATATVRTLP